MQETKSIKEITFDANFYALQSNIIWPRINIPGSYHRLEKKRGKALKILSIL